MANLNIVLYQPEIAMNTGNVGRTCSVTGCRLHLIRPLGFVIDDKRLTRAGMDYWHTLDVLFYENFADFTRKNNSPKIYMVETKAEQIYTEVNFEKEAFIMLGNESCGIPDHILQSYSDTTVRVPMRPNSRSLNLASCAAVVIFEALRQHGFANLS